MKKKIISFILLIFLLLPISLSFAGCKNDKLGNSEKIELAFVSNFKVNISGTTGFAIKKSQSEQNVTIKNSNLVSMKHIVYADDEQSYSNNKNFIYTTVETYQAGNVEFDENKITKVTFIKNEQKTSQMFDDDGNLLGDKDIISQEEIPAQINRLYVTKTYTYMQFIPLVEKTGYYRYRDGDKLKEEKVEVRPQTLQYDSNGVADFDKGNYYSSALSQSFVIDNVTGYIYKIDDLYVESVVDEYIVKDKENNYYKIFANENYELSFEDIMPNKDVKIIKVFTDKYGYTFVGNDKIDQQDNEKKIVYFTKTRYVADDTNQVYVIGYMDNTLIETIKKSVINGIEQDVDENLTCYDLKYINNFSEQLYGYYKGHKMYENNINTPNGKIIIYNTLLFDLTKDVYISFYDNSSILIWDHNNNHIYVKNFDIDALLDSNTLISLDDCTKISESKLYRDVSYYLDIEGNKMKIDNVFYSISSTGTKYYQIVKKDGEFVLNKLEDKTYDTNIFIFQPLNKVN